MDKMYFVVAREPRNEALRNVYTVGKVYPRVDNSVLTDDGKRQKWTLGDTPRESSWWYITDKLPKGYRFVKCFRTNRGFNKGETYIAREVEDGYVEVHLPGSKGKIKTKMSKSTMFVEYTENENDDMLEMDLKRTDSKEELAYRVFGTWYNLPTPPPVSSTSNWLTQDYDYNQPLVAPLK